MKGKNTRRVLAIVGALTLVMGLQSLAAQTPLVTVKNQTDQDDSVTISEVVSKGPGWIVIHIDDNGPGKVIGYTAVKDGINKDVKVAIDSYSATPKLYAMLHVDAGKIGTYEFPGPDVPAMIGPKMVSPSFTVSGIDPRVIVKDQQPDMQTVSIEEVLSNGPGWLVIHADLNGNPGPVIGYAQVADGFTKDLYVKIDTSRATPVLYAMLHVDAGKIGVYEFPGPDVPVMNDGKMVSPPFKLLK